MATFANDFNIKLIIAYLRKSRQDIEREKKTGEDTLSEQETLMNRVLKDYDIPYDMKKEIGSGDKISTRPVFQEIIEDLRLGKYNAIAVKEISRLGRGSYADMGVIYDLIQQQRIFIITPWKVYDPKNPSDLRQIRFELFLSREEFETIRERLTGARYTYAKEGKYMVGGKPFGYAFNPNTQRLIPNEEETNTVRLMFDLYVNGLNGKSMGFQAIATYLNKIGAKTKNAVKWRDNAVRRIILNPVHKGQIRYRITQKIDNKYVIRPEKEWIIVDDAHEPLIDMETWNKAQEKYAHRGKDTRTKSDLLPCELASLIVCKGCGHRMIRMNSTQKYKKQDGEMSIYKKQFLCCRPVSSDICGWVNYNTVEEAILDYLSQLSELDNDKLNDMLVQLSKQKTDTVKLDITESIEQRRKELQNRLNFIKEKFESGIYTDAEYLERTSLTNKELTELDSVEIPVQEDTPSFDVGQVKTKLSSLVDIYNSFQFRDSKNELLKQIFDKIELEITQHNKGRKHPAEFTITPYLLLDFLV